VHKLGAGAVCVVHSLFDSDSCGDDEVVDSALAVAALVDSQVDGVLILGRLRFVCLNACAKTEKTAKKMTELEKNWMVLLDDNAWMYELEYVSADDSPMIRAFAEMT
jgi:hypothetical protein